RRTWDSLWSLRTLRSDRPLRPYLVPRDRHLVWQAVWCLRGINNTEVPCGQRITAVYDATRVGNARIGDGDGSCDQQHNYRRNRQGPLTPTAGAEPRLKIR